MKKIMITSLMIAMSYTEIYAQGCSDAGFCSAGAMQGTQKAKDSLHERSSLGVSLSYGLGEQATNIITPQLEGKLVLHKKGYLELKMPFTIASGNVGKHAGIGDPILTGSYIIIAKKRFSLLGTLGARVGLGKANASENGKPLPMPYQSSLGTTDMIVGVGAFVGRYLKFAVGYQQPIIQYNENSYVPKAVYPVTPEATEYFASKNLKRKGDILFRAETYRQWKKWVFAAGPLFIYHVGNDSYSSLGENDGILQGSEGLTLNLSASASYHIKNARIDWLVGAPLIVRDYRPDGLTRAMVLTLRYTHF